MTDLERERDGLLTTLFDVRAVLEAACAEQQEEDSQEPPEDPAAVVKVAEKVCAQLEVARRECAAAGADLEASEVRTRAMVCCVLCCIADWLGVTVRVLSSH